MQLAQNQYYFNINCARAIAVLLVFFFHLKIELFSGGFIGVDIFFVISGYVISISLFNLKKEKNKIFFFLTKRILRIAPSIIVLSILLLVSCKIILIDKHYIEFLDSVIPANIFYSNYFFWDRFGYFGISNSFKPLLHTWSLSVEMQFYIILPFLIFLLLKYPKITVTIITLISFLSIIFAEIYINRPFVYFFPIFRIHEFFFGVLIFYNIHILKKKLLHKNYFYLGSLIILISSFIFDENTNFPGLNSLLPIIGISIIIFSNDGSFISKNKIINFFGKISYSLYLYHWPIIIIYKYLFLKINLNFFDCLIIFLSTVIVSFFTYNFVELKLKKLKKNNVYILISLFFVLIMSFAYLKNNFVETKKNKTDIIIKNNLNYRSFYKQKIENRKFEENKKNIFFIGDSHAVDLIMSLEINETNLKNNNILIHLNSNCLKEINNNLEIFNFERIFIKFFKIGNYECSNQINKLLENKKNFEENKIVLAFRWTPDSINRINNFLTNFFFLNKKITIIALRPSFFDVPSVLGMSNQKLDNLNQVFFKLQDFNILKLNDKLSRISRDNNIPFIDLYKLVCSSAKKSCFVESNDDILFIDNDHFSIKGMEFFKKRLEGIIN